MQILNPVHRLMNHAVVMPAKAGIPADYAARIEAAWTPAFAGVTGECVRGGAGA
jgi:hypothetical protein